MKTFKSTFAMLLITVFSISCSKDDNVAANMLTFKGKPITFNGLSVDDNAPDETSEYIFTTFSGLNMTFYCKLIKYQIQTSEMGVVPYSADSENFYPVFSYPSLTVRGYVNYESLQYFTISGKVKIKRNDTGDQTFEFIDFKVKAGSDEQTLNGIINLPKS